MEQEIITQDAQKQDNREQFFELCKELIGKRNILDHLDKHLRQHGFAGQTDIPKLVFLSSITRCFSNPVSLAIRGPSSSGKSFSLGAGLRYVPKEAYYEVHGLSAKAIVHAGKLNLQHRHLIIQELAGAAKEGMPFLRQLMTEGSVKFLTVAQTRDGHEGREVTPVLGPVGVMLTTTLDRLYWEDDTRFMSLHVDQSREQIRKALTILGGGCQPQPKEEELSQWHALYNYVCSGDLEVSIPFAEVFLSQLPDSHPRILRDTPKFLSLLRAHTLLQQRSRDRKNGSLEATLEDYSVIHDLVEKPLSYGLEANVPAHVLEVVNAVTDLYGKLKQPVSQVQVAKHLGKDVSRNISTAIKEGFIGNLTPGVGTTHSYIPGERDLPSDKVLPTTAELKTAIAFSNAQKREKERMGAHVRDRELVPTH